MPALNSKLQFTNHKQISNTKIAKSKFFKFGVFMLFEICFLKLGTSEKIFASCTSAGLNVCGIGQTSCRNPTEGALCCTVPGETCQLPGAAPPPIVTTTSSNPVPQPPVPCDQTRDPEFHSLRPYQASSMNQTSPPYCLSSISDYATFCGNTLTINDNIQVLASSCGAGTGGQTTCTITTTIPDIKIDLSDATLPIMGNTEDVVNYSKNTDTFTDTDKMNNYVSWYLNGVINRKEYPDKNNVDNPMATNLPIVNYSGPLNKLLPQEIQEFQRTQTVEQGVTKFELDFGDSLGNILNTIIDPNTIANIIGALISPTTQVRHDQIVVCSEAEFRTLNVHLSIPPVMKLIIQGLLSSVKINVDMSTINTFSDLITAVPNFASYFNSVLFNAIVSPALGAAGIGKRVPVACPVGLINTVIADVRGVRAYRLSDWSGALSTINALINLIGKANLGIQNIFEQFFPWIRPADIENAFNVQENLSAWDSRLPPLPWYNNPNTGKPFTALEYQKAYNEWRGKNCLIIPFPPPINDELICLDTFLTSNSYSDLFPYIPLSSTEDATGSAQLAATIPSTSSVTVSNVNVASLKGQDMFFSHMEETTELTSQLQSTYLYQGANATASGNSVPEETNGNCSVTEVRSNKGDNLFIKPITGSISFTASFTCTPVQDPTTGVMVCTQSVPVTLAIITQTPLVDDIWYKLVAGNSSVFR